MSFEFKSFSLSGAIRLLHLRKGSAGPIQCGLIEMSLEQAKGTYEALSYTWGNVSENREITIDGKTMLIGDNLNTALGFLRLADGDRILWVDYICINQEDIPERSQQVGQMRKIYENASRVVVWLGPSTENIDYLIQSMVHLDHNAMQRSDSRRSPRKVWEEELNNLLDLHHYQEGFRERRLGALEELLKRPWFGRVWVIQEVASAKLAIVACGKMSISTRTFSLMPSLMQIRPKNHTQAVLDVMPGPLRSESWWQDKPDLLALLRKFEASEATDQRDKIYALLGISSDARENGVLRPDYGAKFQATLGDTMSYLLFDVLIGDRSVSTPPEWRLGGFTDFLDFLGVLKYLPEQVLNWALTKVIMERKARAGASSSWWRGRITVQNTIDKHYGALNNSPEGRYMEIFKRLLKRTDVDVNYVMNGGTALWISASKGLTDIVSLLLEKIPDLEFEDISKRTALRISAESGHAGVVQLLINNGAKLETKGSDKVTPLWIAASQGHVDVVRLLLKNGAEPEFKHSTTDNKYELALRGGYYNVTPLWIAASRGRTDVVKLLLENGADPDNTAAWSSRNDYYFDVIPLKVAKSKGYTDVARLLTNGVDPNPTRVQPQHDSLPTSTNDPSERLYRPSSPD